MKGVFVFNVVFLSLIICSTIIIVAAESPAQVAAICKGKRPATMVRGMYSEIPGLEDFLEGDQAQGDGSVVMRRTSSGVPAIESWDSGFHEEDHKDDAGAAHDEVFEAGPSKSLVALELPPVQTHCIFFQPLQCKDIGQRMPASCPEEELPVADEGAQGIVLNFGPLGSVFYNFQLKIVSFTLSKLSWERTLIFKKGRDAECSKPIGEKDLHDLLDIAYPYLLSASLFAKNTYPASFVKENSWMINLVV